MRRRLKAKPGVEMVTSFGMLLHVAGDDAAALDATLNDLQGAS